MKRGWLLPVILAFVLRLSLFLFISFYNPSFMIQPDSPGYVNPAENLIKYGLFSSGEPPNLKPETLRTPGYPLFIALSYLVFGRKIESVIILQIIIGALLPLLSWKILEELGASLRARRIAAYITALDPLLLIYTVNVLTEELYAFIIALVILLYFKVLRGFTLFHLFLASIMTGFQAYIRPVGVYFPVIVFLYFLFLKRFKEAFTILLVSYLLIFGWSFRNYKEAGAFEFSTISGVNMAFYRASYVLQFERGESWVKIREELRRELEEKGRGLNEAQKLALAKRMGLEIILSHPISAIKAFVRGILGTLLGPGGAYYLVAFKAYIPGSGILNRLYELGFLRFLVLLWREYRWLFLVELSFGLYFLFIYIFALLGFWRNLLRKEVWPLILTIFYFLVISAGPEAYSRFRVPFELFLIILCSLYFEGRGRSSTRLFLSW
ncbi:MAG: glycosyltransferase family 39 protein [Synergistetes bacterium]|nr:glycosyltransferase family 39 protein [Synergistota bacterium]